MSRLAPLSQCLHALRGTFERAIGQAQALDRPVLVAASFEIDPLDPLQVFGAWDDRQTPCLYWEQPELAFFAWGCALELQGHGEQRFARIEENWQLLCADRKFSRRTGSCSRPSSSTGSSGKASQRAAAKRPRPSARGAPPPSG